MRKVLPLLAFAVFSTYTLWVALQHGVLGFLTLAGREPWALQLLLDLCVSLCFVAAWVRKDARRFGIPWIPYVVGIVLCGSVGTLAYMVHRGFAKPVADGPA